MKRSLLGLFVLVLIIAVHLLIRIGSSAAGLFKAKDPGVRSGVADVARPIDGLSLTQLSVFQAGKQDFESEGKDQGQFYTLYQSSTIEGA